MADIPFLQQFLPQQIFAFLLLFSRVGSMMMIMPGVGEGFVSSRFRLGLAVAVSFLLMPGLAVRLPALPSDGGGLLLIVGLEVLIGLAIGTAARLLLSSLNIAGNVIALQTGLAFATSVDPTQAQQGAIVSSFLTTLGIVLIFTTGTHQLLFSAILRSYDIFVPGAPVNVGDFLDVIVQFISASFLLGIELSAPFLVLSLVFYAGLGVVAKLMPQFQVFFISMPLSILFGFGLLMMLTGVMMQIFLDRFAELFSAFSG